MNKTEHTAKILIGRCALYLAVTLALTAISQAEDGFEAYKADFISKQLAQVVTLPEDQQIVRYALLEANARRSYLQLTDERKFYWCWMGRYGLNATSQDREELQRYLSAHFSLGKLTDKAYSFDNYVRNREGN
jgi:hypothetical protein